MSAVLSFVFFFQAEDGIRDIGVTGVQTCALPISCWRGRWASPSAGPAPPSSPRPSSNRPTTAATSSPPTAGTAGGSPPSSARRRGWWGRGGSFGGAASLLKKKQQHCDHEAQIKSQ